MVDVNERFRIQQLALIPQVAGARSERSEVPSEVVLRAASILLSSAQLLKHVAQGSVGKWGWGERKQERDDRENRQPAPPPADARPFRDYRMAHAADRQ